MICVKCGAQVPDLPFCGACGWKQEKAPPVKHKRGNGQGRVWKRGSSWYAQVTLYTGHEKREDGTLKTVRRYRTRGGFATKRDALAAIEDLRGPQGRVCPTLLHYWELYESAALGKLSRDKQVAYRIARGRLDAIIGRRVDAITVADLQQTVDAETATYYPARDMKNLLSHLYKLAMADQFVSQNLSRFITLPALEEQEGEPFSELEVRAIWQVYTDGVPLAGHILLMIYSGMMPGELLGCRTEHVDLDACEIRGAGKKTDIRKAAPIVFPQFLAPVVADLVAAADGGKLCKMNKDSFYRAYYAALDAAHVRRLPPYSCRHTTGTEAARANLAAPIVQQLMRHAKITTTQRYIHLTSDAAHSAANAFSVPNTCRTEKPQTLVK